MGLGPERLIVATLVQTDEAFWTSVATMSDALSGKFL
jgi:hypothetical protein